MLSPLRAVQFASQQAGNLGDTRFLEYREVIAGHFVENETCGRKMVPPEAGVKVAAMRPIGSPDVHHSSGPRQRSMAKQRLSGLRQWWRLG